MKNYLELLQDILDNGKHEHAKKFDDRGMMEWNEEQIRWAKIKIAEIEDYLDIQKGA